MQTPWSRAALLALWAAVLLPTHTQALSVDELLDACEQTGRPCKEIPWVQAYIGGALDLIAMLDEETDYLGEVYCKPPDVLFDVSGILDFVSRHREAYGDRNAMLLVIRYFERYGGCGDAKGSD